MDGTAAFLLEEHVVSTQESVGEAQSEGASGEPQEVDIDELVTVRESIHLGPFQTEIIEGWIKPLLGDTAHVMITPLKAGEGQLWEARPLPPGLHILHTFMHLKNGSGRVSLVVRNMSDSHIFLKKEVPVAHVLLEEVRASLQDMLDAGAIHLSQLPWCNAVVLVRKKMAPFASASILGISTCG